MRQEVKEAFERGYRATMQKHAVTIHPDKPLWRRPVSGILGKPLGTFTQRRILGLGPTPATTQADVELLQSLQAEDPDREELAVYPNYVSPWENIKRTARRKDLSRLDRLRGVIGSPLIDLQASLTRADHYNPLAHSITSFTSRPEIIAHEMGHAEDFQNHDSSYMWSRIAPSIALHQEREASRRALLKLKASMGPLGVAAPDRKERMVEGKALLNRALGSYHRALENKVGSRVDQKHLRKFPGINPDNALKGL